MEPIKFPDIPLYSGWGAPLRSETTARDIAVVQGEVPAGLQGCWFRCGPDRQFPPMTGDDIFIDGEGMAHMFRFESGRVDYLSRWVRTERFVRQEQARRSLFGRYRNRYTNDPSVAGVSMGTANTNLVWHGGKLLVLKEDDLPYELDPQTLATRGRYDYDGQVKAVSMTAHPKVDWITNELLTFSFQARGDATRDVVFHVIGSDQKVRNEIWFEAPWAASVHDFAVTPTHIVIPFFPLITDLEVLKSGGPFYQYHPDKQTIVAVIPRDGAAEDIRWFRGPITTAGHMLNAFNEGSRLHLDLCLYHGNCFPFFPTPQGEISPAVPPVLSRMTFDLAANSDAFATQQLSAESCEMPRTDDRYQGVAYRYGYVICGRTSDGASSVGRIDVATGAVDVWSPGGLASVHEPQFVPRSPGAAEGDGWLLVIVNRLDQGFSDLAVLDATNLSAGPVALLKLPTRVRSTFHGTWAPTQALETGLYAFKRTAA